MRALAMSGLLALAIGCGGEPSSPDPLTRTLPTRPAAEPTVPDRSFEDYSDAGTLLLDSGCCIVSFALAAQPDEVAATLLFQSGTFDMALDAGVWWVDACVAPAPNVYYYQAAYPADDDAGVVWVDRVNDAVRANYTSSVAAVVNVFDAEDGASCGTLDAGVHATVPDAG